MYAYIGDEDPGASVEDMSAWSDVASGGFRLDVLPGGHFYLVEQHEALLRSVLARLHSADDGPRLPRP